MNYKGRFLIQFLNCDMIIRDKASIDLAIEKHENGDTLFLQDFIIKYLKNENTWMTAIGLIDAMDVLYEKSKENGII